MKEFLKNFFGKSKEETRLESEKFIKEHPELHEDQLAAILGWQNDYSTFPGYVPPNTITSMRAIQARREQRGDLLNHEREEFAGSRAK